MGLDISWVFLYWEELGYTGGWSLMETASNHLRDSSDMLGRGGCLDTLRFVLELSWLSPGGVWGLMEKCKCIIISLGVTLGRDAGGEHMFCTCDSCLLAPES